MPLTPLPRVVAELRSRWWTRAAVPLRAASAVRWHGSGSMLSKRQASANRSRPNVLVSRTRSAVTTRFDCCEWSAPVAATSYSP